MKLITHKKQIIGIAETSSRDAPVRCVCPTWDPKDKGPIDVALKSDNSIELAFIVYAPEEGEAKLITFARPLTFKLERARPRVTQVTQADLPLRTAVDPATLLQDIAFEVLELLDQAADPAYADHPDYADSVAGILALVAVSPLK